MDLYASGGTVTLADIYIQRYSEEHLYGREVCEAFWLYCYQRREEARFWRLWQTRYGRSPTPQEARIIRHVIAMQTKGGQEL